MAALAALLLTASGCWNDIAYDPAAEQDSAAHEAPPADVEELPDLSPPPDLQVVGADEDSSAEEVAPAPAEEVEDLFADVDDLFADAPTGEDAEAADQEAADDFGAELAALPADPPASDNVNSTDAAAAADLEPAEPMATDESMSVATPAVASDTAASDASAAIGEPASATTVAESDDDFLDRLFSAGSMDEPVADSSVAESEADSAKSSDSSKDDYLERLYGLDPTADNQPTTTAAKPKPPATNPTAGPLGVGELAAAPGLPTVPALRSGSNNATERVSRDELLPWASDNANPTKPQPTTATTPAETIADPPATSPDDSELGPLPWEMPSDEPDSPPATEPQPTEPPNDEWQPAPPESIDSFQLTWQLSSRLSYMLVAPEVDLASATDELRPVASMLGVDLPAFRPFAPESDVERIRQLLQVGRQLGKQVADKYGDDHAAVVEVAFKSNLLLAVMESRPQLKHSINSSVAAAAVRAGLPERLWKPFQATVADAKSAAEVGEAVVELQALLGRYMDDTATPSDDAPPVLR